MVSQDSTTGAKPPRKRRQDPLVEPFLDRIDAALDRDGSDPATMLAEVEGALVEMSAALAPGRATKRIAAASRDLTAARVALREGVQGAATTMREALEAHRRAHGLPPRKPPRVRFGLAAALEDRPPVKSVCRRLEWDVGRPPMIIGPPGAAKTYFAQAVILDLMLGRSLLGCPDFRPLGPQRCLHVDLDQGKDKSLRRYRRLLAGLGVHARDVVQARAELATIADRHVAELGAFDVDEGEGLALMSLLPEEMARWRAAWVEAVAGYDVAFVDSLRRLAPFLDENDSRFSLVPDVLRAISEQAQCVIVLLHHATNKAPARPGPGPAKAPATRGSSAIDGAAGTQLAIEKDKDQHRVTQIRAGESAALPAFYFLFENDEEPGPAGVRGVRLSYRTIEQVKAPEKGAKAARLRAVAEQVLEYVRKINATKGYGVAGRRAVAENIEGARDTLIYSAIQLLIDDGKIRETEQQDGRRRVPRIWATELLAVEG